MLGRLLILQGQVFGETLRKPKLQREVSFYSRQLRPVQRLENRASASKAASKTVKRSINETAKHSMKKKRDYLIGFINAQPLLRIQGIGRPLGSTKPIEQKAREAATYQQEVKEAIQSLVTIPGKAPKKTDVAKKLGIGGANPKTGNPPTIFLPFVASSHG